MFESNTTVLAKFGSNSEIEKHLFWWRAVLNADYTVLQTIIFSQIIGAIIWYRVGLIIGFWDGSTDDICIVREKKIPCQNQVVLFVPFHIFLFHCSFIQENYLIQKKQFWHFKQFQFVSDDEVPSGDGDCDNILDGDLSY